MKKLTARVGAAAVAASVLGLVGCGGTGKGKYTQEHLSGARVKLDVMKSATEYDMGRQSFLAGDLKKALERIDRSIALNEHVSKSHVLRGRILNEMGEADQAIAALQTASALNPSSVEAQYYLGIVYERIVNHEQAAEHFIAAHTLDPSDPQYVIAACEQLIDAGELTRAQEFIAGTGDKFNHNGGVRQTLGHLAMMRGDHAQAVEMFNQARLLTPDDTSILEDLAAAQIAMGDNAKAESNLARLLSDRNFNGRRDLQHTRARCLIELDRLVEARDVYVTLTTGPDGASDGEAWIALEPNRPEGYLYRAAWHRRQANPEPALRWLDMAEQRGADAAVVHQLRAIVLKELGRDEEARKEIISAAAADPTNSRLQELAQSVGSFASVPDVN